LINKIFKLLANIFLILVAKLDWLTSNQKNAIFLQKFANIEFTDVFVYVHWSKDFRPTIGEAELLKQTLDAGLQNLVVLNVDSLPAGEQSLIQWEGLYTGIILRKNLGRDLAAYRVAASALNRSKVRKIFFFNNSVLWLPSKMKSFVKNFIKWDEEIYSATVSYHPIKHMQSFGMAAQNAGVSVLLREIDKIRNTRSKRATITFGEINISRNLSKSGIKFSNGYIQYSDLIQEALNRTNLLSQPTNVVNPAIEARLTMIRGAIANGTPLNPTHHTWLELYNLGFPGLKKDLAGKNKSRIPDLVTYTQYFDNIDSNSINMETLGFLTYPKTLVDRIRRKVGI